MKMAKSLDGPPPTPVNIYANKCDTCGKLIPANLPMNGTCVSCYWRDTYRKEEQRDR
jgi:hypothetical protein